MIEQLSILSLNANGLRTQSDRLELFSWLRRTKSHIIFPQDTLWTPEDSSLWSAQWGLLAIWSTHTAILSTSNILTLTHIPFPNLPRSTFVSISHPHWQAPIIGGSVYVPSPYSQRSTFLSSLPSSLPPLTAFLGGDFNMYPNPGLDHHPPLSSLPSSQWQDLSDYLLRWGLVDLHRSQSSDSIVLTHWHQGAGFSVGTRIDFIFTPPTQVPLFSPLLAALCSHSDHYYLTTNLTVSSALPQGPGYWKLNTQLLQSNTFISAILDNWACTPRDGSTPFPVAWDEAKSLFQASAIFLSRNSTSAAHALSADIELQLDSLHRQLAEQPHPPAPHLLARKGLLEDTLREASVKAFHGLRTRARSRWFEEGERSSSYFHRLIATRRSASRLRNLRSSSGMVVTSISDISLTCTSFYKALYAHYPTDQVASSSLLSTVSSSISQESAATLDKDITTAEVEEAISSSASGSAPGPDGLPFEFYKQFSKELAPFLALLFNEAFSSGSLPLSFPQSRISLLYKHKGDDADLKNWRPIALLNCDRKLLTKILANRIQFVAKGIIHPSQTGFVKGRRIQDNTMAVAQILDYCWHIPTSGSLVFLDQEKAYDRVNWDYLIACLKHFQFGPHLIRAIMTLHRGLSASILINGFCSSPFTTQQGLPQGDPLSPILYNIVLEPFLCFLRSGLQGLTIPLFPFRVSAFADDIVVGISSIADHSLLLQGVALHQNACNASLNFDKCETLFLNLPASHPPIGSTIDRSLPFSHLGIPFHPQSLSLPQAYFNSLLDRLQGTIASWQPRKLSLLGKVLILNSRLLSKLWYIAYLVSFPLSFFVALQKSILAFL